MSGNVTNPFQQPKTATYFGQQVNIVGTTENNNVVIQFEDGTQKVVTRVELSSTPLFNWNQERINKNNQRIEEYRTIATEANNKKLALWEEIKTLKTQIRSKYSEWGTKFLHAMSDEQKAEYRALKGDEYALRQAATAESNTAISASLSAFMIACDNRHYV